ncbi:MAG TPA: twin-arginine translocase subunit TatC [Acidimicrobiales bacterium]|jgi:sec-independent protein translocase protein TatC|nr:twin-arginine translocase subunit TatC [Acidimicrobiales bacterium]
MSKFRRAESGMTLAEHLAELRRRFLIIAVAVLVFGVLGFVFYPHILKVLQHPYCSAVPGHCKFLVTNPLDGLTLRVKIGFFTGFIVSSPVILWQAWRFITPGLKSRERRYIIPFVTCSLVFFLAGMLLAYFSFAHAIQFLKSIGGSSLITEYNPNQYLTLFLLMMFIFGLTFLFPVVLVALELVNIVTPKQLLRSWRYAVIAITVASAVFTPSGDPLSMAALGVPLVAFYFLAIGVGKLLHK